MPTDFLRSLYNIFESVGQRRVVPEADLWEALLDGQSDPEESRTALAAFGFDYNAVTAFLRRHERKSINFTTLLVLLCETRQASKALGPLEFYQLVAKVCSDRRRWKTAVQIAIYTVKKEGARTSQCFCTRVCQLVQGAVTRKRYQPEPEAPFGKRRRF